MKAAAFIYDTNTSSFSVGNYMTKTDTNFAPIPVPYGINLDAALGTWEIKNPFTSVTENPGVPFALCYAAKIPLADWDENAPLVTL